MTVEAPPPEPARARRQRNRLSQLIADRPQRGYPAGHRRNLSIGGRALRVAVREGDPGWPPLLLLCNGIGASLELLQPLMDALDPRGEVIRFDMPGIGGSRPR
jgi:pimeloyl-ACP methyl ester carboxylesterase